jgi:hypothetical protein
MDLVCHRSRAFSRSCRRCCMLRGWGLRMGLLRVDMIWRLGGMHEALSKRQILFNRKRRRDSEPEAMISRCVMSFMRERGEIVNNMMISKHNDQEITRKLHNNNNSDSAVLLLQCPSSHQFHQFHQIHHQCQTSLNLATALSTGKGGKPHRAAQPPPTTISPLTNPP